MVTQNKGKKKQIINVGSYLHLETPNLCEFWSFFGHLNIFHEMTGEIEVKCMAVLYLSPDMYLFYKRTYNPLRGAVNLQHSL